MRSSIAIYVCYVIKVGASSFFFFNDTAPTEIYTLSLHDALPILDRQKAKDLRKLIKVECSNKVLTQKYDDSRCKRYRTEIGRAHV